MTDTESFEKKKRKIAMRKYYLKNREKFIERAKEFYLKNKDTDEFKEKKRNYMKIYNQKAEKKEIF